MPRYTRREWIGAASAASIAAQTERKARKPNVILIMTDDQGYGDLSCHGSPDVRTPNLDALAKQGIEFTRFHVSPVCAPTRSSLLTGRYSLRCGVYGVTRGYETMRREETTLAEALRPAGYRTALIGKWHLGEHYPYVPHAQGFDEFIGFRTGHWLNYFDPPLESNGKPIKRKGYISDVFTDEAIGFIERNQSRPFFLYLAYNAPHSPFQAPSKYFERFSNRDMPRTTAAVFAMVENLDDNIGRLLRRVDDLRLTNDTIVIFLTDNGPAGDRYVANLRGRKASVYEGGTRAPFFIRWPGRLEAGRKVDTLAAHIDVYPTVLALCGVPRPAALPIDGTDLRPLLEGSAEQWPDRMLFTHQATAKNPSGMFPGSVRTQRFNLVNGSELYDVAADPGERKNCAGEHPEVAKRLRAAYEKWFAGVSRECGFQRTPIPVGYDEENPVTLPATQSYFSGEIKYKHTSGFAHDWLAGWTRTEDSVWWEIDVARAGEYEIALQYACPAGDTGSKVVVSAGGKELTGTITAPTSMETLANRNLVESGHYVDLAWATLSLGKTRLAKGRTQLAVKALGKPGEIVMELKSAVLRRLDA